MAEYGTITQTINEMRRAAIDAHMAGQGWFTDYEYADRYALWGFVPSWYRAPDEDGWGGGERIGVGFDSLESSFDQIRSRIEAATSKWLGLPAEDAAADPRGSAERASAAFGIAVPGSGAIVDGEMANATHTVNEILAGSQTRGSFRAPFHDKYDAQFSKVVGGLGSATAVLQIAYAAENRIWPSARTDAAGICESARNAFLESARKSGEHAFEVVLAVVSAVAGVVAAVPTGGGSLVVAFAGIVSKAADAVTGLEEALGAPSNGYDSVMSWLETASGELNSAIYEQESAIRNMMSAALQEVQSTKQDFDLDAYQLADFPRDDMISMDSSDAEMVLLNMDRVRAKLETASQELGVLPGDSYLNRDGSVGLGANGPSASISGLHEVLAQCVRSTRDEYTNGRELFSAIVDDYFQTEAEADAVVRALMRELETREP